MSAERLHRGQALPVVHAPLVPALPQIPTDPAHLSIRHCQDYVPDLHDGILRLCRHALDPADLHYLAFYVRKRPVFRVDVLDHPTLRRFHGIVPSMARRATYDRNGRLLDRMMSKLNAEFRSLDSRVLVRLVLDVERGATYYRRRRPGVPALPGRVDFSPSWGGDSRPHDREFLLHRRPRDGHPPRLASAPQAFTPSPG